MNINKTLKQTAFVVSILILFSSCSTKTQYLNALYNQQNRDAEKQLSSKDMLYDNTSGILYKISNDEDFLVADLQINSEVTQKKILLFGLTMWVDPLGKKKKNRGIKYPIGKSGFKKSSMDKMKEFQGNFSQKKKMLADESNEIGIIGRSAKGGLEVVDKRFKGGLKAEISFDSFGMMYYHLQVPFEKLNLNYEDLSFLNTAIGFETGHGEMNQGSAYGGGMKPGGGGMKPGGGGGGMRSGGGAPGRNPEMQAMMQSSSFWIKNVKFAEISENEK